LNWICLKVMYNPGGSTAAAVYARESTDVNPTFCLCYGLRREGLADYRLGLALEKPVSTPLEKLRWLSPTLRTVVVDNSLAPN
jgi:hypothetical protein